MKAFILVFILIATLPAIATSICSDFFQDDKLDPFAQKPENTANIIILERDLPGEWVSAAETSLDAKVHFRLNLLSNGLRYVTIHKGDGSQIFDGTSYRNDGRIYTTPEVPEQGLDLSNGFRLKGVLSDQDSESASTWSLVEKKYLLSGNAKVRFEYSVEIDSQKHIQYNHVIYEYQKNHYFFSVHINLYKGLHRGTSITVFYNLSKTTEAPLSELAILTEEPRGDKITFDFDSNGKLAQIRSLSESAKPNPLWTNPEFTRVVRKIRALRMIRHTPSSPEANIIFKTIFGQDIENLGGLPISSIDSMLKAATEQKELDLSSLLSFKIHPK